jgi:putative endonuclease
MWASPHALLHRFFRRSRSGPTGDETLGQRGERLAARHLRRKGMRILETHVMLPMGEIDIVAVDRRTIVFVEVKTRQTRDINEPLEAVGMKKQSQLTRLALAYLKRNHWLDRPARFDVVGVAWPTGGEPIVGHVINAFEPVGQWQMHS